MDVDSFIAAHRPDWDRLEAQCKRGRSGVEQLKGEGVTDLVKLYLRVSGHLAEVQGRYHDHRLEQYLTQLVTRAHGLLYSVKPRSLRAFLRFMGARYRRAIRGTAKHIAAMAIWMAAVIAATTIWVATSEEARAGVLPPAAREAIEKSTGERAEFGVSDATVTTIILTNNVRVSFIAFAFGITAGIGTVWVVATNSILIGSLMGATIAAGKAGEFLALVVPHGLLELAAICIAAGAGLRMGWSLVDPKDRPRAQALVEETREAIIVVLGVVPAFIVAALIEGFITGTGLPTPVTIGIGVVVALGYLVTLFGRPGSAESAAGSELPESLYV